MTSDKDKVAEIRNAGEVLIDIPLVSPWEQILFLRAA
jgi:hypothetical protein